MEDRTLGRSRNFLRGFCALVAVLAFAHHANASTVVPMNLRTLADYAGQVIEGDVASVRSYRVAGPSLIETEVIFNQVQYLKGRLADSGSTFRLIVPGGTVGVQTVRICCAPTFQVGQRRILFLLPGYRTFPTVGLAQGAFEIVPDAGGVDRVYQYGGAPVLGFDSNHFARVGTGGARSVHPHILGSDHARLRVAAPDARPSKAISRTDFLAVLQPILDASRDHALTAPAGRRIVVSKTPVGLKTSAAWRRTRSAQRERAGSKLDPPPTSYRETTRPRQTANSRSTDRQKTSAGGRK
ncbi:MAG: hypothetical protein ACE5EC_05225 [Phycisphaerae bacterium]